MSPYVKHTADKAIVQRWRKIRAAALARARRALRVIHRHQTTDKPQAAKGIDVSMHQGTVDFKKVKQAGYAFVWVKATEGEGFTDPNFQRNVKAAKQAGLKVGAYHFLRPRPGRNGAAEADDFARQLKAAGLGKGDLLPVADVEHTELAPAATIAYTRDFIDAVETRTGIRPLLYTYPAFLASWQGVNAPGLWIAHYDVKQPTLPVPFKEWAAWQHSSAGRVPGVTGAADVNVTDDLRELIA